MRPIPFQTTSPFGNARLRDRDERRVAARPFGAAFGSAAGQGFAFGPADGRHRER